MEWWVTDVLVTAGQDFYIVQLKCGGLFSEGLSTYAQCRLTSSCADHNNNVVVFLVAVLVNCE